jgi:hypothetical protein
VLRRSLPSPTMAQHMEQVASLGLRCYTTRLWYEVAILQGINARDVGPGLDLDLGDESPRMKSW